MFLFSFEKVYFHAGHYFYKKQERLAIASDRDIFWDIQVQVENINFLHLKTPVLGSDGTI